jgi:hypothetical protein
MTNIPANQDDAKLPEIEVKDDLPVPGEFEQVLGFYDVVVVDKHDDYDFDPAILESTAKA